MQNDLCLPNGALYIPGAEKDVNRLAKFIAKESNKFDQIILTQDNHQVLDIAHPGFWRNKNGELPPVFTGINSKDLETGMWTPVFHKEKVQQYLKDLETQGEYPHTIWSELLSLSIRLVFSCVSGASVKGMFARNAPKCSVSGWVPLTTTS